MSVWKKLVSGALDRIVDTLDSGGVEYLPMGESPVEIKAVFSNSHVEVDIGDGVPVSSIRPTLFLKLTTIPRSPKRGDRVRVDGVLYRVEDSQLDGEGGALLILNKL
jgi:hypothetical protein